MSTLSLSTFSETAHTAARILPDPQFEGFFGRRIEKPRAGIHRVGYGTEKRKSGLKSCFGIPQSRSRVWICCFRDDIYEPFKFQYPEGEKLNIFIKDILETEVDEKYYLSEKLQERFSKYLEEKNSVVNLQPRQGKGVGGKGTISKSDGTTYCLDSGNCQAIVAMCGREDGQELEPRQNGCSNSLTSVQKDNLIYDRKGFDSRTKGFKESELSPTLSTKMGTGGNNVPMIKQEMLRRLTPKECFRLMGFFQDEINLEGLSDTQKYKLAGNGWALRPASDILRRMLL